MVATALAWIGLGWWAIATLVQWLSAALALPIGVMRLAGAYEGPGSTGARTAASTSL